MEIAILDKKTVSEGDLSLQPIEELGEVRAYDLTSKEETISHIGRAEIVLCNKVMITSEVLSRCKNLKYIGIFATGYNNIDLKAADEYGVVVCNAPSYSTDAVAQHVFALLLQFTNQIAAYNQSVHDKRWIQSDTFSYFPYAITELSGLKMGIIGYGSIGSKVAGIAKAFGMEILVYTRTQKKAEGIEFVLLDEILAASDVLTIHSPLTEQTKGLLCLENFKKMKPTAILINTARGPIIVEQDLSEALNQGIIAGAGLDVLSKEPMEPDNPLLHAKNCVITPHVAWAPKQTRERLIQIVADNIKQYLKGRPVNIVNHRGA